LIEPTSSQIIKPISTGRIDENNKKFPLHGRKRQKLVKYGDESYNNIQGIRSEELLQLYNLLLQVKQATTNYKELNNEQQDILEELAKSYKVMIEVTNKRDSYKQYLDLKYRN